MFTINAKYMVNFNRKLIKTVDGKKSIEGISTGNKGRLKGSKLLNKVIRNSDSQRRFGYRNCTTSTNKLKDTPIKHGYHLEDYNRLCVCTNIIMIKKNYHFM